MATKIFAYLALGIPALVGIAINLYSLRAGTEKFCSNLEESLLEHCEAISGHEINPCTFTPRKYTYQLKNHRSFVIQEWVTITAGLSTESNEQYQERETCMKDFILHIQNEIRRFSWLYAWAPEGFEIKKIGGHIDVTVPLPDYISDLGQSIQGSAIVDA